MFHVPQQRPLSDSERLRFYGTRGLNLRMAEFQGALLATQMARLDEQSRRRTENAKYLKSMLGEIGGLAPVRTHDGCTETRTTSS